MKYPEVTSIGEAFIDFVSLKPTKNLSTASDFVKVAGGAPANVAVGLAKLGIRTAFAGKVGRDSFGRFVKDELKKHGVDTSWIVDDKNYKTRLAFVALTKTGERDFEFWEKDPADLHIQSNELKINAICRSKIINVGPFLLLHPESRKTAMAIARSAKKQRTIICFDPNIRMSLWKNSREIKNAYSPILRLATIIRLNEDEAKFLTSVNSISLAIRKLLSLGPKLIVITQDKKGCMFATKKFIRTVKGFSVEAIDTTGCGDGFLAGLLAGVVKADKNLNDLSEQKLFSICRMANAVGALVATKRGAISAMPSLNQVRQFLRSSH